MAPQMNTPVTGLSCMGLGKQCSSKARPRVLTSVTGDKLWDTSGGRLLWALRTSASPAKGLGQQPLLLGDSLTPIFGLASPASLRAGSVLADRFIVVPNALCNEATMSASISNCSEKLM